MHYRDIIIISRAPLFPPKFSIGLSFVSASSPSGPFIIRDPSSPSVLARTFLLRTHLNKIKIVSCLYMLGLHSLRPPSFKIRG